MKMDYDSIKDELLAAVDSALKYAKTLDPEAEFEVFVYFNNSMEAEIEQGVVTAKDGAIAGNTVRAAIGNRVGFACASGVTTDRVKMSAKEAHEIASSVKVEDDKFEGFCDPSEPGREGEFDERILELGTDDLIGACVSMTKDAKTVDERAKIFSASASASYGGYAIANTRGVLAATRFGDNNCSINVQAIKGEERRSAFSLDIARNRLFEIEGLGQDAAEKAVDLLGAKKLDYTGKMKTIWRPIPAAMYIQASLGQSALGRPVVEGISPLSDMMGDTIAHEALTIVDDGQKPESLGTKAIDHEGHGQMRNVIVEQGVLKGFLFDNYWARAFGVESTGNCTRGGGPIAGGTPYEYSVGVAVKHLMVSPGEQSQEDIIDSVDGKGLVIDGFPLGIFHTNVATGEFSVVANAVYLVENGELKGSVQPVSVSGDFYQGLKNIAAIGNDIEVLPWAIENPTLAFDDFTVVG
ncbi:TldD/PmbA family protein [Candidatus Thorarchaeota archaeon]|nr:MAG: TldD/PmbA family protein [Candidatus Thorarchaeota archaeon]